MTEIKKIAIIDDSEEDTVLMEKAVNATEFDCAMHTFNDAEDAYYALELDNRALDKAGFDLILLDVNMPRVSGIELLSYLKSHTEYRKVPTIMISGSHDPQHINESLANHANAYIVKPDSYKMLVSTLRATLQFWFGYASSSQ